MSRRGMRARVAAAATTVLALVGLDLGVGHAALAKNPEVEVFFFSLPADLTAGTGTPTAFSVKLLNDSVLAFPVAHRTFTVQLTGLTTRGVRMWSAGAPLTGVADGAGRVQFRDPTPVSFGARTAPDHVQHWPYRIEFTAAAASGTATVAFVLSDDTGLIHSIWRPVTVAGRAGAAAPTAPGGTSTGTPTSAGTTRGTTTPGTTTAGTTRPGTTGPGTANAGTTAPGTAAARSAAGSRPGPSGPQSPGPVTLADGSPSVADAVGGVPGDSALALGDGAPAARRPGSGPPVTLYLVAVVVVAAAGAVASWRLLAGRTTGGRRRAG